MTKVDPGDPTRFQRWSPHLTCLVLHITWAGSYVPMLHSIGHNNDSVSWFLSRRDHWCCIILVPQIYYENVIIKYYYPCTGLRQKHKAPGQVLGYCSAINRSIYIVLATGFSSMQKNCVQVCNQACNVVIHMNEGDVQC